MRNGASGFAINMSSSSREHFPARVSEGGLKRYEVGSYRSNKNIFFCNNLSAQKNLTNTARIMVTDQEAT